MARALISEDTGRCRQSFTLKPPLLFAPSRYAQRTAPLPFTGSQKPCGVPRSLFWLPKMAAGNAASIFGLSKIAPGRPAAVSDNRQKPRRVPRQFQTTARSRGVPRGSFGHPPGAAAHPAGVLDDQNMPPTTGKALAFSIFSKINIKTMKNSNQRTQYV